MNRCRASTVQGHIEAEVLPSTHRRRCSIPEHHPSKSTLKRTTASSYNVALSHTFLEGSTAKAVTQVADPLFWGGPIPKEIVELSPSDHGIAR